MSFLPNISTNLYSLIILTLITIHEFSSTQRKNLQGKLFKALLSLNTLLVLLNSAVFFFNGKIGVSNEIINYIVNITGFIIMPVFYLVWVLCIDYLIFKSKKHMLKLILYLSFPIVIDTFFVLMSAYSDSVFYIDNKNLFHRGPFIMFIAATCYLYIIASLTIVLLNKNKFGNSKFISLLILPLPMLAGYILQNINYSSEVLWMGSTISIVALYLSMLSNNLNTDYLTGLYNRRQLDDYLKRKILKNSASKAFAGILIDIDDFKSINDRFGHKTGDEALITAANLLRKCFGKNDLIVRYAGDEFVIIQDMSNPEDLKISLDRLNIMLSSYNLRSAKPYRLKLSLGYAVYDYTSEMTSEEFINYIDILMYEEKRRKKNLLSSPIAQNI